VNGLLDGLLEDTSDQVRRLLDYIATTEALAVVGFKSGTGHDVLVDRL
jgi:hypothetical protein